MDVINYTLKLMPGTRFENQAFDGMPTLAPKPYPAFSMVVHA